MNEEMKKRFAIYITVGVLFGILDWYYLNGLANFQWGSLGESILVIPIILFLNFGIWLLPVAAVAIYEERRSFSLHRAAFSGAVVWTCAITSYYLYYTILLAFFGLPHMEHLLFINRNDPAFLSEWSIAFKRIILAQFLEWIGIALVGGGIVGFLSAKIDIGIRKRNLSADTR
jgi:hypothetical protein